MCFILILGILRNHLVFPVFNGIEWLDFLLSLTLTLNCFERDIVFISLESANIYVGHDGIEKVFAILVFHNWLSKSPILCWWAQLMGQCAQVSRVSDLSYGFVQIHFPLVLVGLDYWSSRHRFGVLSCILIK